ncbi:uncharacterized protein LOC129316362 [Prosopis cineraria]|uniref:uncharacterized protein LOC129316362 n=1 Tax=Prosopis cineraria TaxID=364024 RepID=UPI00240EFFBB|nr:uncharacterized protein LOC129316362 [Prosopis cineraria]
MWNSSVSHCQLLPSMAFPQLTTALLFALALATIDPSTCQEVKAKVSCLDCPSNFDLSGIKVSVKCEKVKKLGVATTEHDGSFKVKLPTDSGRCVAQLVGGPEQLYTSRKSMFSRIVKAREPNTFTISTPLSFHAKSELGSSKTVDLPLPPEWGLAPSSYYVPFFPIIGIP